MTVSIKLTRNVMTRQVATSTSAFEPLLPYKTTCFLKNRQSYKTVFQNILLHCANQYSEAIYKE